MVEMAVLAKAARPPHGFRDHWSTIGGMRLHALESTTGLGSGDARSPRCAVLLPGLVTASRSMVPLARALGRSGLRVLAVDPPGFGYSAKPPRALPPRRQADLLAQWVRVAADGPVMMLGNSFGCQLAAAMAADHPDTVSSLVLLSPTVAPGIRRKLAWLRRVPRGPAPGPGLDGRRRLMLLTRLHRLLGQDPPLRLLNLAEYICASIPRAVSTLRHAVLDPIEDYLPRIPAPTLLIRGEDDRLSSPQWARQLASICPDGRLVALPGLGHDAFYADPGAVAVIAVPFLLASSAPPPSSGPALTGV